jgi:hypothetical protein
MTASARIAPRKLESCVLALTCHRSLEPFPLAWNQLSSWFAAFLTANQIHCAENCSHEPILEDHSTSAHGGHRAACDQQTIYIIALIFDSMAP